MKYILLVWFDNDEKWFSGFTNKDDAVEEAKYYNDREDVITVSLYSTKEQITESTFLK
jgi:hypothetical protein